jgi:hypothetical protein
VNLHHVDVASTAALAGFEYPVSRTADVTAQPAGRADPRAGTIRATNAAAFQESIESFDATWPLRRKTSLNNIQLTHQDAAIAGSAAYTPATRSRLVDWNEFPSASPDPIHLRLLIEGRSDFTLKGSGTLDRHALADVPCPSDPTEPTADSTWKRDARGISCHGTLRPHGSGHRRQVDERHYPANITARSSGGLGRIVARYRRGQLPAILFRGTVMKGPLRYPNSGLCGDEQRAIIEYKDAQRCPVRY